MVHLHPNGGWHNECPHKHADGDTTVIEGYRVYYGDERQGEYVDSRCVIDSRSTKGLIIRQVRE
jgi:hypothetical protein